MTFKELKLNTLLLRAIEDVNYTTPTSIQSQTIPIILSGSDLIASAQTGTGKTASFVLPIVELIISENINNNICTLILAPTRELVQQISNNITEYTKYCNVIHLSIYGGQSIEIQLKKLKTNPKIIVATPGRLLDLIENKLIDITQIKRFVLDEADQMLDMGFLKSINKIISYLPRKKQTLLFSATMPKEIRQLAKSIQYNAKEIVVERVSSTNKIILQSIVHAEQNDKINILEKIITIEQNPKCIVFVRTKYGADKLVKKLKKSGFEARAIHGNKSQNSRNEAIDLFKKNEIKILIATDIAARGLDIEQLPLVINYDLPNVAETYIHRIGRTGRAGNSGKAVSLCSPLELKELNNIQKLIGKKIETQLIYQ